MLFCKVHFSKSRAKIQKVFHIRKRAGVYYQKTSIFTHFRRRKKTYKTLINNLRKKHIKH